MRSHLKIGLLLHRRSVPYWAFKAIEIIGGSDYAEIALLILCNGSTTRSSAREPVLYRAYQRIDRRINGPSIIDPRAYQDLPAVLDDVETIALGMSGPSGVPSDALAAIKARKLDVLVDVDSGVPLTEISRITRLGVLSFSPGDGVRNGGDHPGMGEILDREPLTGSYVMRTYGETTSILYRSFSHTEARSERKNRDQVYLKGISFLPRVLESIYREETALAPLDDGSEGHRHMPSRQLGNRDMLRYYARRVPENIAFLTKRALIEERWAVRYRIGGSPFDTDGYRTLMPPPRTWWGDPQAAVQDGQHYIFIEELTLPENRNNGRISVIKVDDEGNHDGPIKVLERPYHLSYPFVFQWKGTYYLVPESSIAGTVELCEAVEFPYEWRHVKNLMTGVSAVDTTLLNRDGRWWLFCNIRQNAGAPYDDELFLFHADDLLTDRWEPHPLNPIVSDARNARPAGAVFEHDGALLRPSQDCSTCYGYAININEITELTSRGYRERPLHRIEPWMFRGARRVHTFSHVPGMTVIDTYMGRSKLIPGR